MQVLNLRKIDTKARKFVYIGRAGQGYDGYYGNPYSLRSQNDTLAELRWKEYFAGWTPESLKGATLAALSKAYSREECLEMYRKYLRGRLLLDPEFKKRIHKLKRENMDLGCFCANRVSGITESDPLVCHGQVILEYLNGYQDGVAGGYL